MREMLRERERDKKNGHKAIRWRLRNGESRHTSAAPSASHSRPKWAISGGVQLGNERVEAHLPAKTRLGGRERTGAGGGAREGGRGRIETNGQRTEERRNNS